MPNSTSNLGFSLPSFSSFSVSLPSIKISSSLPSSFFINDTFSNFCFFSSSFKNGIASEGTLFYKHMAQTKSVRAIRSLFSYCMTFLYKQEQDQAKAKVNFQLKELDLLTDTVVKEWEDNASTKSKVNELYDADKLKSISLFRNLSPALSSNKITPSLFRQLFNEVSLKTEELPAYLKYHNSIFPSLDKSHLNQAFCNSLLEASSKDRALKGMIDDSITKKLSAADSNRQLYQMAEQWSSSIDNLTRGNSFVHFVKLSSSSCSADKEAQEFDLIDKIKLEAEVSLSNLRNQLMENLPREQVDKLVKIIPEKLEAFSQKMQGSIPDDYWNLFVEGAKEDISELLGEDGSQPLSKQKLQALWKTLQQGGVDKLLADQISKFSSSAFELAEEGIDGAMSKSLGMLPEVARPFLSSMGLGRKKEPSFWIEISKEVKGKYTLALYGGASSTTHHACFSTPFGQATQQPIIFSGLDKSQLNSQFFHRLLSYRAWPKLGISEAFSLNDAYSALEKFLGKPDRISAQKASEESLLVCDGLIRDDSIFSLFKTYLHVKSRFQIGGEFEEEYIFKMHRQALLDIWSYLDSDPEALLNNQLLRESIENAFQTLLKEAVDLYKKKKLSLQELKAIYATVWEAKDACSRVKKAKKRVSGTTPARRAIQGELTTILKKAGLPLTHATMLRETLLDVFGNEVEEIVDQSLKEIAASAKLLHSFFSNSSSSLVKKKSPSKVVGKKGFISEKKEALAKLRFSPLGVYRAAALAADIFQEGMVKYLAVSFARGLLIAMVPGFAVLGGPASYLAAYAFSEYGPTVARKILPAPVFKVLDQYHQIHEIFGLYQEVKSYIANRCKLLTAKMFIKELVNDKDVQKIRGMVKKFQSKVLMDGEISYKLSNDPLLNLDQGLKTSVKHQPFPQAISSSISSSIRQVSFVQKLEVTEKNNLEKLDFLVKKSQNFSDHLPAEFHQLTRMIAELPIPGYGSSPNFWDNITDPEAAMEKLHDLMINLHNLKNENSKSLEGQRNDFFITYYSLYTIIDHLAKRVDPRLKKYRANGEEFALQTLTSSSFMIDDPLMERRFMHISSYFGYDYKRYYTYDEINKKRASSLFNYLGVRSSRQGRNNKEVVLNNLLFSLGGSTDRGLKTAKRNFNNFGLCFSSLVKDFTRRANLSRGNLIPQNADMDYFSQLLADPDMNQRFPKRGLAQNASNFEKMAHLFIDAPLKESSEQSGIALNSQGGSQRILPRPYYILRLAFFLTQNDCIKEKEHKKSDEQKKAKEDSEPFEGLSIQHHNRKRNFKILNCDFSSAVESFVESAHRLTGNLFRQKTIQANLRGLEGEISQSKTQDALIKQARGNIDLPYKCHILKFDPLLTLTQPLSPRRLNHIIEYPLLRSFNEGENNLQKERLQEILSRSKVEQPLRAFAFFIARPELLCEKRYGRAGFNYFSFLEMALFSPGVLKASFESDPEAIKTLGKTLLQMIENMGEGRESYKADLIELGCRLKRMCDSYIPKGEPSLLPNFYQLLEQEYTSLIKRGKEGEAFYVLKLFSQFFYTISPNEFSSDQRRKIFHYLALSIYDEHSHAEDDKKSIMKSQWQIKLEQIIKRDPLFRKNLIEAFLKKQGINPAFASGKGWTGSYPRYCCNGFYYTFTSQKSSESFKTSLRDKIFKAFPSFSKNDQFVISSANLITLPSRNISILLDSSGEVSSISCMIQGKKYLYDFECSTEDQLFWIEEGRDLDLRSYIQTDRTGEILKVYSLGSSIKQKHEEEGEATYTIKLKKEHCRDGMPLLTPVDLSKSQHELTLLEMFQPLSKISAWADPNDLSTLRYFRFDDPKLEFEVKEINGVKQAFLMGDSGGFYIAKRQKIATLDSHSQCLLLENEYGEKKVMMLPHPPKRRVIFFFATRFMELFIPPKFHKMLSEIGNESKGKKCYTYNLDANGRLTASDPEALSYLLSYHFVQGNQEESMRCLKELEAVGRLKPFSEETFNHTRMLSIALLFSSDQFSEELALRMAAICQENNLLRRKDPSTSEKIEEEESSSSLKGDFLFWALLQVKYMSYLEREKRGERAYLNDYQELYILNALAGINRNVLTPNRRENETNSNARRQEESNLEKIIKQNGIDFFCERLLLSSDVRRRYHFLLSKHQGNLPRKKQDFIKTLFNLEGTTDNSTQKTQGTDTLATITLSNANGVRRIRRSEGNGLLHKVLNTFVASVNKKNILMFFVIGTLREGIDAKKAAELQLEDLPTSFNNFLPGHLVSNFFLYYRLAMNQPRKSWKKDSKKMALFKKKRKELKKTLNGWQGDAKNAAASHSLAIIQMLFSGQKFRRFLPSFLPSSDRLETLFIEHVGKEKRVRAEEIAKQLQADGLIIGRKRPNPNFANYTHALKSIYRMVRLNSLSSKAKKKAIFSIKSLGKDFVSNRVEDLNEGLDALRAIPKKGKKEILIIGAKKVFQVAKVAIALKLYKYVPYLYFGKLSLGVYHSMKKLSSDSTEASKARKAMLARVADPSLPLPKESIEALEQREKAIDQSMKKLLSQYFDSTTLPSLSSSTAPFDLEPPQGSSSSMREQFDKVKKSIEDYYARPSSCRKRYTIKSGADATELKNRLLLMREGVIALIAKERREVEAFVNKLPQAGTNIKEAELFKAIDSMNRKKMTFQEAFTFFLKDRDQEILEGTHLTPEELISLKKRFLLHMVLTSRFNLLFKALDQLPNDPTQDKKKLEAIAIELARSRVYGFRDESERMIKTNLAFESAMKVMLWDKPRRKLKALLESNAKGVLLELIMGMGKSFFVIPSAAFFAADGRRVMINIWPKAVAKNNIASISQQSAKVYHQDVNALEISRQRKLSKDRMWGVFTALSRAQTERGQLNMTKEDLQGLELCFIEQALDVQNKFASDRDYYERLTFMKRSLALIKENGMGSIDEAHEVFDPKKELCFPVGRRKKIFKEWVRVVEEVMMALTTSPETLKVIDLQNVRSEPLPRKIFFDKVQGEIAKKLVASRTFKIAQKDRKELLEYVTGKATRVPQSVLQSEARSEIALLKGLLTVLLPSALESEINVDMALSNREGRGFAIPSNGNNNPQEGSTIRNVIEAYLKTTMTYLHNRLSAENLDSFIQHLRTRAEQEKKLKAIPFEMTSAFRFFAECCPGHRLGNFEGKERDEVHALLNANNSVVLSYVRIFVAPQMKFHQYNLRSDAQNFSSMFSRFFTDTGTPYNLGCCPTDVQAILDKGNGGETIDILAKKCTGINAPHILSSEEPKKILDEMVMKLLGSRRKRYSLADRGALLQGLSNRYVAHRTLQLLSQSPQNAHIRAVIFYDSERGNMIWEKNSPEPIPVDINRCSIPPNERITYYDQARTFAWDIPQDEENEMIFTVGENLLFYQLAQTIWRQRGLKRYQQKLLPVMTASLKKKVFGNKQVTIKDILEYSLVNQERMMAEDRYRADRQKMYNVVRRAVLDKAFKKGLTITDSIKIIREFEDIFLTKVSEDPFEIYGAIDAEVSPEIAFAALRKQLLARLQKSQTFRSDSATLKKVYADLELLGRGNYPEKVHVYKSNGLIESSRLDDLGQEMASEEVADLENEQEQDEEMDLQQRLNQQSHLQKNQKQAEDLLGAWKWPASLEIGSLEWLKVMTPPNMNRDSNGQLIERSTISKIGRGAFSAVRWVMNYRKRYSAPPIFSLREALKKSSLDLFHQKELRLSSQILATNNFLPMMHKSMAPSNVQIMGSYQKPALELLIIEKPDPRIKGKVKRQALLLDSDEVVYWRKRLEEERNKSDQEVGNPGVKFAIYSIANRGIIARGKHQIDAASLESSTMFQRTLTQIKFLNGDVSYDSQQQKILSRWIKACGVNKMRRLFIAMNEAHGIAPFSGSILEQVFLKAEGVSIQDRYSI